MNRISTGIRLLFTGMPLLLLAGCGTTPPTSFYLLTPVEQLQPSDSRDALPNLVIGVGPIRLSDYLGRPQIVARENVNRLQIEEFDRWGGTLETNVSWVVAENLSTLLGTDSVLSLPWERAILPAYQVTIDIRRLDAGDDSQLDLIAVWGVLNSDGRELLAIRRTDIQEPISDSEMGTLVAAQSRALGRMSEEIASAIRELHSREK